MRPSKWILTALLLYMLCPAAYAVDLTISCGAVGQERALCEQETAAWAKMTGNTVRVTSPPDKTNERYFQYLLDLGAGKKDVDVYQIDVIWPGLLAKYFIDLSQYVPHEQIAANYPAIIENNTVEGKLVGMPWFTDVGLLYYRKDLIDGAGLKPPETWSELTQTALEIQQRQRQAGNGAFWGFVFQGAPYEGLTCNALEWINSYGGGTIVADDGRITVDNPYAVIALAQAGSWVGTIAPQRVTAFSEEDARTMFQLGNAAFMRNWPYAWALLNGKDSPVAGKVGVTALPKGGEQGRHTGTLGGWQLAVSRFSAHPKEAAELVAYLTSRKVQKERAIAGSYAPTIMDLYNDQDVLAANPFFKRLPPILENAVARPSHQTRSSYMAVSTRFWNAALNVLQGRASAQDSLAALSDQLRLIESRGGAGW